MKANQAKQEEAIKFFRRFLEGKGTRSEKFPMAVTNWKVETTDHGTVWISANLEHTTLGENSVLRLIDRETWFVAVGPRGKLTVYMCPKSCEQFAGRRAFGMKFRRDIRASYKPRKAAVKPAYFLCAKTHHHTTQELADACDGIRLNDEAQWKK